jgi:hypothetical protein
MRFYTFAPILLLAGSTTSIDANQLHDQEVPGVVITHSPASTGIYVGSPGIAKLSDTTYLAKCDEFGPGSKEHRSAITNVFRSDDRGDTWHQVARVEGLFWATLFSWHDAPYLLGMNKHHGAIVLMRSDDQGRTWSTPDSPERGLLTSEGEYHTAPVPVIEHRGRLWRAVEDAMGGTRWGSRYRARMMSIPLNGILLSQDNWTLSEPLASQQKWMNGEFHGWLEGNAVVTRNDKVVNILRIACSEGGKAAIVHVSDDGKSLTFDPTQDIIEFPGGAKKFTIRFDPVTDTYWTLSNPVMPRHDGESTAGSIRNTLALMRSKDLTDWEIRSILLYHPDIRHHGFQYPDWLFDGDDLIAAIRTAYDDGQGGAHNAHDANYLTFHRFRNFRELTMADSCVRLDDLKALPLEEVEVGEIIVRGRQLSLQPFGNDQRAFSNRTYVWNDIPSRFAGWTFTQVGGGERARIEVTAKRDMTIYVATSASWAQNHLASWEPTGDKFCYTDANRTSMVILSRRLKSGETSKLLQGSWAGTLLLLPPADNK